MSEETIDVISEIAAERQHQCSLGYTPEFDDAYRGEELLDAALCYGGFGRPIGDVTLLWPWVPRAWNPKTKRENLIRAAALIVAEIERMDRKDAVR
jgi:hypothetical protein